jgi:hypothetical protein
MTGVVLPRAERVCGRLAISYVTREGGRCVIGGESTNPRTRRRASQMRTEHTRTDAAIVGGGMAGLTVACYLARAGVDVTVFEKAPELGGRAATQNVDGFRFNRGGHTPSTPAAQRRGSSRSLVSPMSTASRKTPSFYRRKS